MPNKRESAFLRAQREAQQTSTYLPTPSVTAQNQAEVLPSQGENVQPSNGKVVRPSNGEAVKKDRKITFYFTKEEADKLNDLETEFWIRFKRRVNRNDIVRYLVRQSHIDTLEELPE